MFQVYSKMIQLYICVCVCVCFFRFCSIVGYYKITINILKSKNRQFIR